MERLQDPKKQLWSAKEKSYKSYFEQNAKSGDVSNKLFWKTIRPFLISNGTHDNHDIILEENGDLIKDKENISDILNDFYINIVEKTTGKKPLILNSAFTVSAVEKIDIINRISMITTLVSEKSRRMFHHLANSR